MDSSDASGGVKIFWQWLNKNGIHQNLNGVEIGCGKGRNCIWLAEQGVATMTGIDFSTVAIQEAKKRSHKIVAQNKVHFLEHDVTLTWPFPTNHFDFAVDCFASTDIGLTKVVLRQEMNYYVF